MSQTKREFLKNQLREIPGLLEETFSSCQSAEKARKEWQESIWKHVSQDEIHDFALKHHYPRHPAQWNTSMRAQFENLCAFLHRNDAGMKQKELALQWVQDKAQAVMQCQLDYLEYFAGTDLECLDARRFLDNKPRAKKFKDSFDSFQDKTGPLSFWLDEMEQLLLDWLAQGPPLEQTADLAEQEREQQEGRQETGFEPSALHEMKSDEAELDEAELEDTWLENEDSPDDEAYDRFLDESEEFAFDEDLDEEFDAFDDENQPEPLESREQFDVCQMWKQRILTPLFENPARLFEIACQAGILSEERLHARFVQSAWDDFCDLTGCDNFSAKTLLTRCLPDAAAVFSMVKERILSMNGQKILAAASASELGRQCAVQAAITSNLMGSMESKIQSSLASLYVQARAIDRHFVIHIGETNSGKTYHALQALQQAKHGVYLGPLRLLAYEIYQRMNEAGVPASLLTGEEEIETEDARVVCSTCEMADLNDEYDVAVIDEAQLLDDALRGGAWSEAILGLPAREIHITAGKQALDVLERMIASCNDTMEVAEHKRLVPLVSCGPVRKLEKGDALVVFSRMKVHALAGSLHAQGWKVSILYGNLPYQVRHREAEKFARGETDILVTTDAIGMGLNLPIRRVIFEESEKYDGSKRRCLSPSELSQIAGRAGRYGQYDTGYYGYRGRNRAIAQGMMQKIPNLQMARVSLPSVFRKLEGKPTEILATWNKFALDDLYLRQETGELMKKAVCMERVFQDSTLVWEFILMTFDVSDAVLWNHWKSMAQTLLQNEPLPAPANRGQIETMRSLKDLEQLFKILDLHYQYHRRFSSRQECMQIMKLKDAVSWRMMKLMEHAHYEPRRCRLCHQPLRWNYPHAICQNCYEKRQQERLAGWPEELDFDDFD